MTPLLAVENLRTWFYTRGGVIRAVDGIDFSIPLGGTLGVVGESGSGKSVTALSVMQLIEAPGRIEAGTKILLEGNDLAELPEGKMARIRGNDVSMIFQEPMTSLNPVFTVGDQIAEAVQLHQNVGAKDARDRAVEMMELVGIPSPAQRVQDYPHQLSGGMRQRVMIAMALSCNPKLLIADEPTTALDVTVQAGILRLLDRLRRENRLSVILITHDLGVMSSIADHVSVFYAGRIVESGPTRDLLSAPRHPYTRALLDALPHPEAEGRTQLLAIPGMPPSPRRRPSGCAFHPRCAYATDESRTDVPPLVPVSDGRLLACHVDPFAVAP